MPPQPSPLLPVMVEPLSIRMYGKNKNTGSDGTGLYEISGIYFTLELCKYIPEACPYIFVM